MTVDEALRVAFTPYDANRPILVEALDVLARAYDQDQAHKLEEARQLFLHGSPSATWSNTHRVVS